MLKMSSSFGCTWVESSDDSIDDEARVTATEISSFGLLD